VSAHYTFLLTLPLESSSAEANAPVLDFIFNEEVPPPPTALPDHAYFKRSDPLYRIHSGYKGFAAGAWSSSFWRERHAVEGTCRCAGVNLCLPGNKLEAVAQDLFPLAQWLASMSPANGPVGIVVAEDLNDNEPMVLYIRDARLFVGSSKLTEVYAVDDGRPYASEA
jgi:hypothetical protein